MSETVRGYSNHFGLKRQDKKTGRGETLPVLKYSLIYSKLDYFPRFLNKSPPRLSRTIVAGSGTIWWIITWSCI
jgi:hypothetical protein